MRIVLLANYVNSRQQSMQRFAEMLRQGLTAAGHEVRLVRPPVWLGRLQPGETGLGKWIGYIDRFLLYPRRLRRQVRWADVIHICDHANAVYIPHLGGRPHVVTCHDMLAIRAAFGEIAEWRVGWSGRIYQRWILRHLSSAQQVACVSYQTAEEVKRVARLPHQRLDIVHNALNYPYRPMLADEAQSQLLALGLDPGRPFFLHVGGNQWYKNRAGVLRLFAELVKHPGYGAHALIMAGKPWTQEMRRLAASLDIHDRAIERVEVSNEQLRALYSRAEALLFPSLQEGSGWPVAEAQACGCPIVASNRAPMTEIGGSAGIYIEPTEPVRAAGMIVSALINREYWHKEGLENAQRFSTKAMIDGYVRCYRAAMGFGSLGAELRTPSEEGSADRGIAQKRALS